MHDALLHGEALLVVAAGDFEDVAFELGGDAVADDLLAHALVHEAAEFAVVFDLDEFLGAVGGVGDVELHLYGLGGGAERQDGRRFGGFGRRTQLSSCVFSPSETLCELKAG